MLQKLQWDSLQQRRACSMVLMLYRIRNGLIAIPAAAYLEPVHICTRRFETIYVQIQWNTDTYSQIFFPSAIRLWNTLPVDICHAATSWQFQNPSQQFPLHLNTGLRPVFIVCTAVFYPKLLFIVCSTAFSITHVLIHSWCDIARNRVGTVIGRWRWTVTKYEHYKKTFILSWSGRRCAAKSYRIYCISVISAIFTRRQSAQRIPSPQCANFKPNPQPFQSYYTKSTSLWFIVYVKYRYSKVQFLL